MGPSLFISMCTGYKSVDFITGDVEEEDISIPSVLLFFLFSDPIFIESCLSIDRAAKYLLIPWLLWDVVQQ